MSQGIIEINCPGCGARVSTGQKECEWCHQPIVISTFNSIYSMSIPLINKYVNSYKKTLNDNPDNSDINKSIAMCYLKLKKYDDALRFFEKSIEDNFDDSESYFYVALCSLKGKKAFLNQRLDIDKALENINAAIMIEPKGVYYYFLAYLKYDYFERKHFKTDPNYRECLKKAVDMGLSEYDIEQVYNILGVSRPECL